MGWIVKHQAARDWTDKTICTLYSMTKIQLILKLDMANKVRPHRAQKSLAQFHNWQGVLLAVVCY
jgi:hypothetical protein